MSTFGRILACWLLVATAAAAVAQSPSASPATILTPDKAVSLDIPDTGQEQRRPAGGWCGEAAIQMAMSHYGVYASQKAINRAGKPAHPDLYANEIPVAMESLGMEFKPWRGEGLAAFQKWIRSQLAAGHPVLLGIKIYPTAHPDWGLDHFVLAVGCTNEALTYNTTWKRQETKTFVRLSTQEKGLSFANRYDAYYGYAITGLKAKPASGGSKPTRIRIGRGDEKQVELYVTAENLDRGTHYRLVKFADLATAQEPDAQGDPVRSFVADGPRAEFVEKVGIDEVLAYRCVAEP